MGTALTTFVDAVRQNRLLEPNQLSMLTQKLQPRFPDPKALAKELLRRAWLTPYQVNQLLQEQGRELLLGSYVLLERLGEGGMGQVFKARNWKLGQVVALKMIQPDRLANPTAVRRFHREIRATAAVNHPNIVRAIDADQVGGAHLLVMEYVEGTDLSRLVKQSGALPVRKACDHIRQAALGLQHAHEQGLVHRDIKPSNLLLAKQGGVVKILDLGLARLENGDTAGTAACMTQSGAVVGTPDFMAPEQVRDPHSADVRADIYSLGCSLYYLLTGQPPFPGGSATEKVLQHMMDEPRLVEQLRPDVPAELAAVVRKLMAKRPEDRYQTPAEAAAALQGLPGGGRAPATIKIKASDPPTLREDAAATPRDALRRLPRLPLRWLRAAAFALLAVVVLGVGFGATLALLPRSKAPLAIASQPDRKELAKSAPAATRKEPAKPTVRELKDKAPVIEPEKPQNPPPEERLPVKGQIVLGEPREKSPVYAVAISTDGRVLASGGADKIIRLWDTGTWRELSVSLRGHTGEVRALAFSSDGRMLASASADETVKLWDVATGGENASFAGHPGGARAVAFSPDGRTVASGADRDENLRLWDVTIQRQKESWKAHEGGVHALVYAPNGQTLASGGADNNIRLWDVATSKEVQSLSGHSHGIHALAYAPSGKELVSGTRAGALRLWAPPAKNSRRLNSPRGGLTALAFSPDSTMVVSANGKNQVILWDLETTKTISERPFTSPVHSLAYLPNGLVAAGTDVGTIHVIRPDLLPKLGD